MRSDTQVTARNTLDKLQRLAYMCITRVRRTCPTAALEVILDLTFLHIAMAHAAMYRLTRAGTKGNQTPWKSRTELSQLLNLPNGEVVKKYSFKKNFPTKLSNKKEWKGESYIYF
ncbi:hypothetical protein Trydic_g5279 [Trypoxylus dichotomus]